MTFSSTRGRASIWIGCLLLAVWKEGESFSIPLQVSSTSSQSRMLIVTICAKPRNGNNDDSIVDAVIESDNENDNNNDSSSIVPVDSTRRRKRDMVRDAFKRLAELSLKDYKWRSSIFKSNEADRRVEESLARMRGEDPSYVRPMDASEDKIGPLGKAERMAVMWLSKVIEEEGKRAERILNSDGRLVRPIDAAAGTDELGPLADLEKQAVDFIDKIRDSEKARVMSGTLRPKDLEESMRGPLGDAEAMAVQALRQIQESETLRCQQSRMRGGEVVRPIDVPGPLGEFEKAIVEVIRAEQQRVKDRERNKGSLVRPKDASVRGPLGEAEDEAMKAVARLTEEEYERLRNIQRVLQENRPMEADRDSPLGLTEAVVVGILRAPQLLLSVVERVKELMQSEPLDETDKNILDSAQYKLKLPAPRDDQDSDD